MSIEKRILGVHELRATKTSKGTRVTGRAASYGVLSHSLGNFKERIKRGAFNKILATNPEVIATINHNPSMILGRTGNRTLQLRGTDAGLEFDCELPNTSYARDLHENIRSGNLNSCSFAFELNDGEDDEYSYEDGVAVRTINNFKALHDISIVTTPAYPGTEVDARNLVAAEVRLRVERMGRVQAIAAKRAVSADAWADLGDWLAQQRRNDLLKLIED